MKTNPPVLYAASSCFLCFPGVARWTWVSLHLREIEEYDNFDYLTVKKLPRSRGRVQLSGLGLLTVRKAKAYSPKTLSRKYSHNPLTVITGHLPLERSRCQLPTLPLRPAHLQPLESYSPGGEDAWSQRPVNNHRIQYPSRTPFFRRISQGSPLCGLSRRPRSPGSEHGEVLG